jgi:hypothetical protein
LPFQIRALDALTVGIQRKRVNWVLDADIRGFFDNMSGAVIVHRRNLRLRRYAIHFSSAGAFAHQWRRPGGLRHWHEERTGCQLPIGHHHHFLPTATTF